MINNILEKLKTRLLDLTFRNKLLNLNYKSKSLIRVVDEVPFVLFDKLNAQKSLIFEPVPEPKESDYVLSGEDSEDEKNKGRKVRPSAKVYAAQLGINTSYELSNSREVILKNHKDDQIQTLFYGDELEKIMTKIFRDYKTLIDETGNNLLYMSFGTIEFFESDSSQESRKAPLILMPIELKRIEPEKNYPFYRFSINANGEDPIVNVSLLEKLKRDFGIVIPNLTSESNTNEPVEFNLNNYFDEIVEILKIHKPKWRLIYEINMRTFDFGKLVLFKDLESENWSEAATKIDEHSVIKQLCIGNSPQDLSSKDYDSSILAKDYSLDEMHYSVIPNLIYDADSSQHSAIIDAASGKNLVIQGPPGTGKSQTITNLIAVFLSQGKSVLFVAEKLAALEVVKNRMDGSGLGDFCFELHSTKIQKKAVAENLGERIKKIYPSPDEIHLERQKLDECTSKIIEYLKSSTQKVQCVDKTFREVVGAYTYLKTLLPNILIEIPLDENESLIDWSNVNEQKIKDEAFQAKAYFAFLKLIQEPYGVIENHPWYISKGESPKASSQAQIQTLKILRPGIDELIHSTKNCSLIRSIHTKRNLSNFILTNEIAKHARLAFERGLVSSHLRNINDLKIAEEYTNFLKDLHSMNTIHRNLLVNDSAGLLLDHISDDQIQSFTEYLKHPYIDENFTFLEIKKLQDILIDLIQDILNCEKHVKNLSSYFDISEELNIQQTLNLAECIEATFDLKKISFSSIQTILKIIDNSNQYNLLKTKFQKLIELKSSVKTQFHIDSIILKSADFLKMVNLATGSTWWSRLFNKQEKEAFLYIKNLQLNHKLKKVQDCRLELHQIFDLLLLREQIQEIQDKTNFLGDLYLGEDTDFQIIDSVILTIQTVKDKIEKSNFPKSDYFGKLIAIKDQERLKLAQLQDGRMLLPTLHNLIDIYQKFSPYEGRLKLKEFLNNFETQKENLNQLVFSEIFKLIPSNQKISTFFNISFKAKDFRRLKTKNQKVLESLNSTGFSSHWDIMTQQLIAFTDYYNGIKSLAVSKELNTFALTPSGMQHFIDTGEELSLIDSDITKIFKKFDDANFRVDWIVGLTPEELRDRVNLAYDNPDRQGDLDQLSNLKKDLFNSIFSSMYSKLEKILPTGEEASLYSEYLWYQKIVLKHISEDRVLKYFNTESHEQIRKIFQDTDRNIILLNRKEIAAKLGRNQPPKGVSSGLRSNWTESSLIQNEVSKTTRHIPIRQLIKKAGHSIKALKPCFMMSPQSVAQFIPPGSITFDVIIMDEASQLRPEDALGAIARGQQLVVVGDSEQLPPTSFFGSDNDDDDLEEEKLDYFESILEQASGAFRPNRSLKWHYRSQHESLIAYSNSEFYQSELILFPTPNAEHPDFGIKLRKTYNAIYEGSGINTIEAREVVAAVKAHAFHKPSESLGVVTLNKAQRDLIEDLLLEESKNEPILAAFINEEGSRSNKFFVKNLENVQGDERDVIFISVTYGKDSNGNFYQRFGPINQKNGYRRLNVLFSRAKKRMEVFCSFSADNIAVTSAKGAKSLKGFLEYAETGRLPVPSGPTGRQMDSKFELSVANAIQKMGYKVEPQFGVAGYFIDLAIESPGKPGHFMLAVECDGATYHSSKSARDRDRLRQQNLENLGWKVHRIWSTDWFRNEKRETLKLREILQKLCPIVGRDEDSLGAMHAAK